MKRTTFILVIFFSAVSTLGFASDSKHTALAPPFDLTAVKPILTKKCAICHASEGHRPFSSKIPIWNYAAGTNVGLARKKYDMDALLEKGRSADEKSIKMLEQVIKHKKMPPPQYKLIHPKKRITNKERQAILSWIYSQHPEWEN